MTFARLASKLRSLTNPVQSPLPKPNASALLVTLPNELIEEICKHLEDTAVRTMRLLCKAVADALFKVAFRTLVLSIDRMNHQKVLDKLQMLVEGRCPGASRGTRVLAMGCLSLGENGSLALEVRERMKSLLPATVSTLSGVHTVEWVPQSDDSSELQSAIADAIITLPNLKHVRLTTAHFLVEFFIPRLPPLLPLGSALTAGVVRDLIAKPSAVTSLHFLFKDINATKGPPLKLTTLFLNGLYVRLDDTILPHLKNLQSLEIRNVRHPERETEGILPGTNTPNLEHAASFSDFWKALKKARIALSHLVIASTFISDAFAEYITSYTGLKHLTIKGLHPDTSSANESQADAFWDGLATHHGVTLLCLTIYPWYEGGWCFSQKRALSLGQCGRLHTLNIAIATADLDSSNGEIHPPLPPDLTHWDVGRSVNALFHTVNANMPGLEQLIITATDPEHIRYSLLMGARPGVRVTHFSKALKRLSESVAEYATPLSRGQLPDLQIDVPGHTTAYWKSVIMPDPRAELPSAAAISKKHLLSLKKSCRSLLGLLSPKSDRPNRTIPFSDQSMLMYRQVQMDDEARNE